MGSIFEENVSLKNYNTYHVGGVARGLAVCEHLEQITAAMRKSEFGAVVLGKGSNILVSDSGYDGHVIINRADTTFIDGEFVLCYSGQTLSRLAEFYAVNSLTGLEWARGIPGTVGGAVIMNAGAFGSSFGDSVAEVLLLNKNGKRWISGAECCFGYRKSEVDGVVLAARLKFEKGEKSEIINRTKEFIALRASKQPSGFSAGSVFKGLDKPAGWYIESAGLKGFRVGGAVVSSRHANFIINDNNATASDIRQVINTIKGVVLDRFGVKLQEEIKYLGEF